MRVRLPGTKLLGWAARWFPPDTIARVFEPLVADWQRECADAAPGRRRLISMRGYLTFAVTALMMSPGLVLAPSALRARPLAQAACFWLVTSCVLALPYVQSGVQLRFLWLLLPPSLTWMLPFAVVPAIDAMRRDRDRPTPLERRTAMTLVACAVLGVVIGQGWVVPAANQRWRNKMMTHVNGRPTVASRGLREVTTSELIAGHAANLPALSGTPRVRELNKRLSLAALPALLAWLRWRSLDLPRRRKWPVLRSSLLAVGATAAFIAVMPASGPLEALFLAPGFGPSLATGLFALLARTGIWWRQRAV